MRRVAMLLALAVSAAQAAEVEIVQPDGRPATRATALCVEPASAEPLIVTGGRVAAPGDCRRLRCDATGFLPGEARLGGASPRCTLQPATIVSGELSAAAAATGLEARLLRAAKGSTVVKAPVPKAAPGARTATFAFPPVPPGRYTLQVARASDGWTCRTDLGPLAAGSSRATPAWRDPVSLPVRVKLGDGKPAPGVPVRSWSGRLRGIGSDPEPAVPFGMWACAFDAAPAVITDAAGAAQVGIDLAQEALIVAGSFKAPQGLAYATLDRAPAAALSLTLSPPVVIKAKVVDERERPTACDAMLEDLAPDVRWIAKVVEGAATRTSCDTQGALTLGPIPSTAFTLDVLPRPGLPLQLAVDPPAPGTTADLGILRVRSGERFRVVVQDERALPVSGAKVTVRGAAGVVLMVVGTTGEDGGVDLSGLPKNASVAVTVKVKGFLPLERRDLELDASPFVVKLSRGGAIAGTVTDREGAPIEGALVGLWGENNEYNEPARTDARGTFSFDGVADGRWRVSGSAPGYVPSEARSLEIREHRSVEDLTLELSAAERISGRVVDPAGGPVAGARVGLYVAIQRADLTRSPPAAEAMSAADGTFSLQSGRDAYGWVVATKSGFGPCVVRASDGGARDDVELVLTEPASLIVHVPRGANTTRGIAVRDGVGLRSAPLPSPATDLTFTDLAPGLGAVQRGEGAERGVRLIAGQTAEVTLEAAGAIEGRVTFDGIPSARTIVRAIQQTGDGGLFGRDGSFTDEKGRYRIEAMAPGSYRLIAVGEDGRAEATLQLAEGETGHVDLALRAVRLIVTATDSADGKLLAGLPLSVTPAGKVCNSSSSSSSWSRPDELGFDISVGSNGCVPGRTDAAGIARLSLAAPGSYDLVAGDQTYEPLTLSLAVGEGTTVKRIALTRKPDRSGDKPHLVANLLTDPPGLFGRVECRSGGNTNSSAPVSLRFDCGEISTGRVEVGFHVEGYGRGRVVVDIPAAGEYEVDLTVARGGVLVVPISQQSTVSPIVVDGTGFAWANGKPDSRVHGRVEDLPSGGSAWVFRDLPPGVYTVTIGGKSRPPVPLISGATAYAN